jgi:thioredoxin reductase (NADPH)
MHSPACIIVDDDPGALTGLTRDLEHRYGGEYDLFATLNAHSGLGILERLKAAGQPVALIIADLWMPDMTGLELLSRARSLHPLANRAVLVDLLGFGHNEALDRAMTLGQADYWLTKPWEPRDRLLYPLVSELLGEWAEDSERPQFVVVRVVGERRSRRSHELRDLLDRHDVSFDFHAVDTDEGREVLRQANHGEDRLPVLVLFNGRVLVQPTNTEVIAALGYRTRPDVGRYDLAVVGGGPAGLSTALYAASEGLRTLLVEREAFGGQAGTTPRIRNYLGFPRGISGRHLARKARQQAGLFGAEKVYGEAIGLRPEGAERVVLTKAGSPTVASAVVVATGVTYRRLGVPSVEQFVGAGVFYGGARSEAPVLRGEDVYVVGGGNAAGQAADHLSRFARRVTLVAPEESLAESMSDYMLRQLESIDNVSVRTRTRVVDAAGSGRLEQVTLAAAGSGAQTTVPAAALFVLIGTEPRNEWLAGALELDASGFILTGRHVPRPGTAGAGFPLAREPFPFESSMPGVFAVGDVRANSTKRVAAAVGEGSQVIHMVHDYLRDR